MDTNTIQRSVVKTALKIWVRLLLASVFCFVVWASIFALGTAAFSEVVGYQIFELDESGVEYHLLKEYRYTPEEDRAAEIKIEENQTIYTLRENSPQTEAGIGIVSSIFTLVIFGVFPYSIMWRMGSRDENFVHLGRMQADALFGLKTGLLTAAPTILLYILLVLGKYGLFDAVIIKWYRILNVAFIPYLDAVYAGAEEAAALSFEGLLAAGAIVLFIPLVCSVAYALGFAQISVRESLIYKKKSAE